MSLLIKAAKPKVSFDYDALGPVNMDIANEYVAAGDINETIRSLLCVLLVLAICPIPYIFFDLKSAAPIWMVGWAVVMGSGLFMGILGRSTFRAEDDYREASAIRIAEGAPGDGFPMLLERYRSLYEAQGNRLLVGQIRAVGERQRQMLSRRHSSV